MSHHVLFIDSCHPALHEKLSEAGFKCDLFWDRSIDELMKILPNYEVLVIRSKFKITKEIIDKCIKLKCIARAGAGMENIDVDYAEKRGIKCVHAPEGNRQAVGEHTLGMLLALTNKLIIADKEVREGKWNREKNRGTELANKKVGIIGFGNMGSSFAKCLSGIGCEILVYDKYKSDFQIPYIQEVPLEQIFEEVDIVSLHTPLTAETKYMFNKDFFYRFKKKIIIVNTARGQCLNTSDLVESMKAGKVLGSCLDVLEYETLSFEGISNENLPEPLRYLFNSPNIVLSPHIAGWTIESNEKIANTLFLKISDSTQL